jgi:plasmid stabilization system protein ParE
VGQREIIIKEPVADSIAEIAWYIESKGLVATAERFADDVYDFFAKLSDSRRSHAICRDPERAIIGYKCIAYKRKYTIVFLESDDELIICEFIPSKNIHW